MYYFLHLFSYNLFMYLINTGKSLEIEQPKFADCRSLLRSGPAASLRVNIRAVSQAFFVYFLFNSNVVNLLSKLIR